MDKNNVTQLAAIVADAIMSGDLAKLEAGGIRVQDTAVDCNSLEEKLSDPEVQAKVFGDVKCDPEMMARLAMATLSASSAPTRRRTDDNAPIDVVIDDVDEALLAKVRAGVTLDSIGSSLKPNAEAIDTPEGKKKRITADQRRENARGENAEAVFTELLKATIAEQERTAGSPLGLRCTMYPTISLTST
jgi:hypothetical protein